MGLQITGKGKGSPTPPGPTPDVPGPAKEEDSSRLLLSSTVKRGGRGMPPARP